jgi:membrane protease YdiL (CAAX protease family)
MHFRSGAGAYFGFALGWSVLFWGASAVLGGPDDSVGWVVFLVGGAGPLVAALALTLREEPATRRDFWVRVIDIRRLRWPWLVAALGIHPALVALAFLANAALGGEAPPWPAQLAHPLAALQLLFFVFWFGPLPEEMGWRGFALDRLQLRMGALNASLVLGSVWALWHVPLFFIPDTFQHELGLGSLRFWLFLSSIVPLSVLITWVYNNTSRSTLSAVLVHFSGNLSGQLFQKDDRVAALELAFLVAAAVLVTVFYGPSRLSRVPFGGSSVAGPERVP